MITVSEDEVRRALKRVNIRKAAGPDGITGQVLRSCAVQLAGLFTSTFNESLATSVVPTSFKKSIIIPVPKNNKPSCLNDYRPVALTSIVMKVWRKEHESMDPSCLVSTVQAGGGGVMVWGIFSWHTLGPLVPIEHRLNATAYLSIAAQIISDWFLEHDNEFTLLKWPPQSPDLRPIEHLLDVVEREIRIMDVQPTNLQQLCDAIMSIWTKISEECFQHLVESMP